LSMETVGISENWYSFISVFVRVLCVCGCFVCL